MFDSYVGAGPEPEEPAKWESYFARWPIQINGKWYWRSHVWRKPQDGQYIYGDDFDALKE
jgi:hypothetical protein